MTIIKQFETQETKSFPKKVVALYGIVILTLVIAQIWANNTLASFGENFETIQQKNAMLQMENQVLENKIAALSSLNKIASESATLGLSTPKSIQYVH